MLRPVILLLVVATATIPSTEALFSIDTRILEHFHKWNTFARCWGEDNMLRYYQVVIRVPHCPKNILKIPLIN